MNIQLPKIFVAFSFIALFAGSITAAEPTWTKITVKSMHCDGCARKIAAHLYTVTGVKEVRFNLAKKTLFVLPQANVSTSPLALWEAVEKAKNEPIRLVSPKGTFTKKPKS